MMFWRAWVPSVERRRREVVKLIELRHEWEANLICSSGKWKWEAKVYLKLQVIKAVKITLTFSCQIVESIKNENLWYFLTIWRQFIDENFCIPRVDFWSKLAKFFWWKHRRCPWNRKWNHWNGITWNDFGDWFQLSCSQFSMVSYFKFLLLRKISFGRRTSHIMNRMTIAFGDNNRLLKY